MGEIKKLSLNLREGEMTIKEIAKALKLSATTVSVCLGNRENDPRYQIRAEKAELIRAFAREHGYVPDRTAQRLRAGGGIPPVGLIYSERFGFEKFFPAIRKTIATLQENGREYLLVAHSAGHLSDVLEFLRGVRVRDVIMFESIREPCPVNFPKDFRQPAGDSSEDPYLTDWKVSERLLADMTMYIMDYNFPRPVSGGIRKGLVRMGADLTAFIRQVLKSVKDAGMGPVATVSWSGREQDFVPDLIASDSLIFSTSSRGSRYDDGRRIAREMMEVRKKQYFRSVFVGNDAIASGMISEFCDCGLEVPGDIAVLGWGNDEPSSCCRVPLSTFRCFIEEFAGYALDAILRSKAVPAEICRPYEYIQRKSFIFFKKKHLTNAF